MDFDDTAPEEPEKPDEPEAMELGERERVFEVEWRRMVGRVDGPTEGEVCEIEDMTGDGCEVCINPTAVQRVSQWRTESDRSSWGWGGGLLELMI